MLILLPVILGLGLDLLRHLDKQLFRWIRHVLRWPDCAGRRQYNLV